MKRAHVESVESISIHSRPMYRSIAPRCTAAIMNLASERAKDASELMSRPSVCVLSSLRVSAIVRNAA